MAIHTDLPIYRTGAKLLQLAIQAQQSAIDRYEPQRKL